MQLPTVRYGLLEQPKLLGKKKKRQPKILELHSSNTPFSHQNDLIFIGDGANKQTNTTQTKIPQFLYLLSLSLPSTFSIPFHTSLHTNSLHTSSFTYFLPAAFAPSLLPSIYITVLPSDPTFCLSSAMPLAHFRPFTEVLSCQVHFSLYLSKYTKV